jgi:hypothetical protein
MPMDKALKMKWADALESGTFAGIAKILRERDDI